MKRRIALLVAVLLLIGWDAWSFLVKRQPKAQPHVPAAAVAPIESPPATPPEPAAAVSLVDQVGSWLYGYTIGRTLSPADFRADTVIDVSDAVHIWHPSRIDHVGDGYYPYVARNTDNTFNSTHGWGVRPGELAMEGSVAGQYSVARFSPNKAGIYHIVALFEGIHNGLSTTDVHILHNQQEIFVSDIDGFGGNPAYHPIVGSSPTAKFDGDVQLQSGDELFFAVGVGRNGTNVCDTTGLIATITLRPG